MRRAFKASNGRKEYYRCAIRLRGGGRKWVWGKTKCETVANFMGRSVDFVKPNDDNE